jgi:WD40 repeat protein
VPESAGEDGSFEWVVRDLRTNDIAYRAPKGWGIHGVDESTSRAVIHSLEDCETRLVSIADTASPELDLEAAGCIGKVEFSPNGELVVTHNLDDTTPPYTAAIFNTATGELLRTLENHALDGLAADFTPDSSQLVVGSLSGTVTVFDIAALLAGEPIDDAAPIQIPAHDSVVRIVTTSPDGSMAFSTSRNEPLKLWSLETGQLLGQFGSGAEGNDIGAFHPTLPQVMVASPPNLVRIHTLDMDELVDIMRSRLTRDLTEDECQLYLRMPCAD